MKLALTALVLSLALAPSPACAQSTIGPYFRVDFQEGFEGWKTLLLLEGEPVYRDAPVTDPVVSLCGSVELMGRSTVVEMRLVVREAVIDTTFSMDITAGEFLGLSIVTGVDGSRLLSILQSTTPFGYD
jgi:hypothetical protein